MRIGFDISQTGAGKAGCGFFADGLIRQLSIDDHSNQYLLYPAVGDFFWDPEATTTTFMTNRYGFRRWTAVLRRKSVHTEVGNPVTFCNVRS